MTPIEELETRIRAAIAGSDVPEDPTHAEDTLAWLLHIDPTAGDALRLAALGHDIDRAVPEKTRRADFEDYDAFKAAHARRSAELLRSMFVEAGAAPGLVEHVCELVERHEVGGTIDSDLLQDADSLSFFTNNLPAYLSREGEAEALSRCTWGLRRLSPRGRALLRARDFDDPVVAAILRKAWAAVGQARGEAAPSRLAD